MTHPDKITLTTSNIAEFPSFKKLLDDGKIIVDRAGRLRYPHGAPVGRMIFSRVAADGTPQYKESAEEWFDPGSPMAQAFKWPE